MKDIAHLCFGDGGLILPAKTAYERQLLVENVEATTKRYGNLQLHVAGGSWNIRVSNGRRPVCDSCSQWPDHLAYPGGTSGALSVVSSRARPCLNVDCDLAQVLSATLTSRRTRGEA